MRPFNPHDFLPTQPTDFLAFGGSIVAVMTSLFAAEAGEGQTAIAGLLIAAGGILLPILRIWAHEHAEDRKAHMERHALANRLHLQGLELTLAQGELKSTQQELAIAQEKITLLESTAHHRDLKLDETRRIVADNRRILRDAADSGQFPALKIDPDPHAAT